MTSKNYKTTNEDAIRPWHGDPGRSPIRPRRSAASLAPRAIEASSAVSESTHARSRFRGRFVFNTRSRRTKNRNRYASSSAIGLIEPCKVLCTAAREVPTFRAFLKYHRKT